jgi:hypothetical protein
MISALPSPIRKSVALLILLTLLFSLSRSEIPNRPQPEPARFAIRATPLPLGELGAKRPRGLPLQATGFWSLRSDNPDFGGLSALSGTAQALHAISDNGALIDITPGSGIGWGGHIAPFPAGCQRSELKADRDAESITRDPATGTVWIGLESRNAICRVSADGRASSYAPPAMKQWPIAGGPEAMVRLRDGRFVIFQETPSGENKHRDVLIFDRDPLDPHAKIRTLRFVAPDGFSPVDAGELPDGRLLILVRRFELPFRFSARLLVADPVSAGQTSWEGREVARFDAGRSLENWEGLMIEDRGEGKARIWMIADDNFMPIQNTTLLRLNWTPRKPAR